MRSTGALLLGLGLSSCALFRDFDSLASEHEPMTAEEVCANRCDDGDPCTIDRCLDGGCVNEPITCSSSEDGCPRACEEGRCVSRADIVPDGLQETTPGDIYYSQLLEHEERFFHAIHGRFNGSSDILLRAYPSEGAERHPRELALATTTKAKGYQPISPGSMIATRFGALYTYFAAHPVDSGATTAGTVLRVATDFDLNLQGSPVINVANVSNFRFRSRRLGPVAGLTREAVPFVAWEGCTLSGSECMNEEPELVGDGGLYVQIGDEPVDAAEHTFHPHEFRALAALSGANTPAVVWLSHAQGTTRLNTWSAANATPSDAGVVDAAVVDGGATLPLTCVVPTGAGYSLSVAQHRPQLWGLAWTTRVNDDFLGALSTLCAGPECAPTVAECMPLVSDVEVLDRTQHVVLDSVEHPESADETYQIAAHTFSAEGRVHLALRLDRIDPLAASPGPHLATVSLVSASTAQAPEWPTLAVSSEGKLLVSWIQPRGVQSELHVQRHKICFGEPSVR